jgi:hypothetical protein
MKTEIKTQHTPTPFNPTPLDGHQCHECEDKHFYKRCNLCLHEYCDRIYLVCPRCKEQKHSGQTATPWTIEEPSKGFDGYIIHGADNVELATLLNSNEKDSKANAAFIVRACNAHEELLNVVLALKKYGWKFQPESLSFEVRELINMACDAIAKAEGK